jgi:alanine or glycine:cation symporter, AGCS family
VNIFSSLVHGIDWLLAWPLIFYVIGTALICTVCLGFVQFRYFFAAWRDLIWPEKTTQKAGDMTPFQAFVNTLSTNLGNGSIGGVAAGIATGGPGAAFWIVALGFMLMSVRFAEVFLSIYFGARAPQGTVLGGPMLYLKQVIGGNVLSYLYAISCFIFGLIGGALIQSNTMSLSLHTTWGIPMIVSACLILIFILYVLFGGTERVVQLSDYIVPVKVIVFFVPSFIILGYHYQSIASALQLIISSAFQPLSIAGGVLGFSVQQAMRYGMNNVIFATESGVGTAAILFGSTGSKEPVKSALMSMLSTFISMCVCFIVALCVIVSGVWNSGLTSTALTIAAFQTVFGSAGGWLVSFLSLSFGMGVMVAYVYITRAAWLYITGGRMAIGFILLYSFCAFVGPLAAVRMVWEAANYINAALLFINLFGILYLLPIVIKAVREFSRKA